MARSRYGSGDEGGTTITIPEAVFERFVEKCPEISRYEDSVCWNRGYDLIVRDLSPDQLTELVVVLKECGEGDLSRSVVGYLNVLLRPGAVEITNLKRAELAIVGWLREDLIRGWVFNYETGLPEIVVGVEYVKRDMDTPAHINFKTKFWARGELRTRHISANMRDLRGKKIGEFLFSQGYIHETPELVAKYDEIAQRYAEVRTQIGGQFLYDGKTRVVVNTDDDETITTRVVNNLIARPDEAEDDLREADITQVPVHPFVQCFDLGIHEDCWLPLQSLTPYPYNPNLRSMLVLPPDHVELIESLVSNMDLLIEDVIAGKSGGTTILCQGPPGTGKTLTAEVYAEVVKRPLYRFHSGQLGTEPKKLEESLKGVLERAERWGAVPLIDEADVFLMARGADLQRNAVVGVFLRLLEYYKGLLFLTTNRLDAIDDAIVSRCIAVIKYQNPPVSERLKIWRTQAELNGLGLTEDQLLTLAEKFECSGRDIKGLVRLTGRFCKAKNKQPEFADFQRLAAFRGM